MSFPNCFIDSFAHYGTADLLGTGNGQKWTGIGTGSTSTNTQIFPGGGISGPSFRCILNSTSQVYIFKTLANLASWVVGFRFRASTLNGNIVCALYDAGTPQVDLRLNTDGTLQVTRNNTVPTSGKSTNTIAANTWHYIEMMCTISSSISANTWQVNVDGVNFINVATGQSSKNTANATANQFGLGQAGATGSGSPIVADYCDLYVDGGGSVNSGAFWGDTKIECRWPAAVGTYSAWATNGGLGPGCVDDQQPNGDVNFLSDNTTNDKSTFTFPALSSTPTSIMCVQVVHDSRKNDAGSRSIADFCRSGSTDAAGTTVSLGNSYLMYTNVLNNDPSTAAPWTASGLNAAEFGIKEIS